MLYGEFVIPFTQHGDGARSDQAPFKGGDSAMTGRIVRAHSYPKTVVLAAGGTGGHVFPASALAEELGLRGYALACVTDLRGAAAWSCSNLSVVHTHAIVSRGLAGDSLLGTGAFLSESARLIWGMGKACLLFRHLKPKVVVGFGGYAAVPATAAAVLAGYPTVVHEQNAVLGRANRLLMPWVSRVAVSSLKTYGSPGSTKALLEHTGVPVRREVRRIRDVPYVPPNKVVHVLIIGGSQGARVFSEVMPATMGLLPVALRSRMRVSQQVRAEDCTTLVAAYGHLGIDVEVKPFFNDLSNRLAESHLVIARAGASTVAELAVAGRPSILVPYPHATDDHQTANARVVAEQGGAWLIQQAALTPERLAIMLQRLLSLPTLLTQTAIRARRIGLPDATQRLADLVDSLSQCQRHTPSRWGRQILKRGT